jgi:chromosome segregation ATPase
MLHEQLNTHKKEV